MINCSINTLKRAYKEEIKNGKHIANMEIVLSAFQQAKSGRVPAMTMFWLKCRCGWREKAKEDEGAEEIARKIREFLKQADGQEADKPDE